MKELYEKYKGRFCIYGFTYGYICGYSTKHLIMSIEYGEGWKLISASDQPVFVDRISPNGYYYTDITSIKFKFGR